MSETCDVCHADATHFLYDTRLDNEGVEKLRAEVERLREAMRDVAERQREACAESALRWSRSQAEIASDKERDSIMASAEMHREESIMASRISAAISATPLVTEDK